MARIILWIFGDGLILHHITLPHIHHCIEFMLLIQWFFPRQPSLSLANFLTYIIGIIGIINLFRILTQLLPIQTLWIIGIDIHMIHNPIDLGTIIQIPRQFCIGEYLICSTMITVAIGFKIRRTHNIARFIGLF